MKKSLLIIFSFLVLLTFLSTGCLIDGWNDIQILDQNCLDANGIIAQLSDDEGTVTEHKTDSSFLYISIDAKQEGFTGHFNLIPCNLDLNQLKVNAKVKVSGIVYQSLKLDKFQDSDGFKFSLIDVSEAQVK